MEVDEVPTFSLAEAEALAGGEADPYGTDHLAITWQPKERHVVARLDGEVVGHAGFLPIEVEADRRRLSGVGLGGVMVHPAHRGRGVGAALVADTDARMRETGRPFAQLFCRDVRIPFYARLGWQVVPAEVTVDQESGPLIMPLNTCWLSFDDTLELPAGELRVLGLPF